MNPADELLKDTRAAIRAWPHSERELCRRARLSATAIVGWRTKAWSPRMSTVRALWKVLGKEQANV